MWHVCGRGEVSTGFLVGKPEERHHMEGLDVDEWIVLKWTFKTFNP
jgi:hypothetical protein